MGLLDESLPAIHSQALLNRKNQLVLVCTNAVYEIALVDRTAKKATLTDNLIFQVGAIKLRVLLTDRPIRTAKETQRPPESTLEPSQVSSGMIETNIQLKLFESALPKNLFIAEIEKLIPRAKNVQPSASFRLFQKPLLLTVETGPQADDEFILAWGPRDFGPASLEFPIEFPPFPGILFTLSPNSKGEIVFSTNYPDFSRVSGHKESTCVIPPKSKIEAGSSIIFIDYLKGFSHRG